MATKVAALERMLSAGGADAPIDDDQARTLMAGMKSAAANQATSFNKVHGRLRKEMGIPGYRYLQQRQYPQALDRVAKQMLLRPAPGVWRAAEEMLTKGDRFIQELDKTRLN